MRLGWKMSLFVFAYKIENHSGGTITYAHVYENDGILETFGKHSDIASVNRCALLKKHQNIF